jgi:uncharacterized protein (DUF305 family)|nr:MAG TPA: hypothetical protein [Caudoviricetes sp.]
MIVEMPVNLKNKNKEELIALLNESLIIIKKQEQEIKESNKASDKWFNKMIKQDEKFSKERKQLESTIDKLITALAEETGTDEDYIGKIYLGEDK